MKLLITGCAGMLGKKISHVANSRGHVIVGTDRHEGDIRVDLADDDAMLQMLHAVSPDVVINCAAVVDAGLCERDPLTAWNVNARCVGGMAEYCRSKKIQLVQISTEHYFTGGGNSRHDEFAPPTFLNHYARTKFAGEAFAAVCPQALIIRTNIVGFRRAGPQTFAEWAFKAVLADQEMKLFADSFVSCIDVGTFSRSLLDLLDKKSMGLLNLASRDVFSKKEFILEIARQLGIVLTKASTGSVRELPVIRADSCGLDVSRAESILGYQLPALRDVVGSLVKEWKLNEG